jgi:hypothetical protein
MAKGRGNTPRMPAMKFANLRKKMQTQKPTAAKSQPKLRNKKTKD